MKETKESTSLTLAMMVLLFGTLAVLADSVRFAQFDWANGSLRGAIETAAAAIAATAIVAVATMAGYAAGRRSPALVWPVATAVMAIAADAAGWASAVFTGAGLPTPSAINWMVADSLWAATGFTALGGAALIVLLAAVWVGWTVTSTVTSRRT